MKMYFRTFNDYNRRSDDGTYGYMRRAMNDKRYTLGDLGKGLVYSENIRMNSYCLLGGDHYKERCLNDEADWRSLLQQCIDFTYGYFEIGFVVFSRESGENDRILTASAHSNVYSCIKGCDSFFIVFNARPRKYQSEDQYVTIGYDKYTFERDSKSIILWNLEKFATFPFSDDFTVWGIEQNTGGESVTDDVLVGIHGNERIFV